MDVASSLNLNLATDLATGGLLAARKSWSERRDLNSGPLAPHASALPDCATLRHEFFFLEAAPIPQHRGAIIPLLAAAVGGVSTGFWMPAGAARQRSTLLSVAGSSARPQVRCAPGARFAGSG